MRPRILITTALTILTTLAGTPEVHAQVAQSDPAALLKQLGGEWIYFEDRTEGRALEQQGPPMSSKFSLRFEEGAVVLVSGHGSGHTNVRVPLDGSATDVPGSAAGTFARYRGEWKNGAYSYSTEFVRSPGTAPQGLIQKEFRMTGDGLLVSVSLGSPATSVSIGLYRHAHEIPLPTPARATIGGITWLAGGWVGTRGATGATSIEERWGPPLGGAMLGISRTVTRERMTAFEYLRIVERDGGLVYIAQPNGAPPTEFVLTELTETRAVFDNPRHDYPKRLVYELSAGGGLSVTTGFIKGGTPPRYDYKREGR